MMNKEDNMSILIQNGLVVTSTSSYTADVYVDGKKIQSYFKEG